MFIRKETVDALEKALLEDEVQFDHGEVAGEGLDELDPVSFELDEVLTAENVEVTLEGLDKDFLLGVDSQAGLNKLTENHPAGKNRVITPATVPPKNTTLPTEQPQPVPDNSNARANPNDPFKFAFLSVVATYDANCSISLEDFDSKLRCCTFDPTWFHRAVLTFPKSECRVVVFQSGKFVITGVASIKNALIAARNTLEILKMCGFDPEISKQNFRAKNLTAMMELSVHVDITGFAEKHPDNTYMDQDTFGVVTHLLEKGKYAKKVKIVNGVKVHKGGFGMCFLIFATGRIVMIGGRNEKHMIKTFRDTTLDNGHVEAFCLWVEYMSAVSVLL